MWEGETLQSKSSFSEEQLCAFVRNANRPAKRKGTAFAAKQPQSDCESFLYLLGGVFLHVSRRLLHCPWKIGCNHLEKWCVKRLGRESPVR